MQSTIVIKHQSNENRIYSFPNFLWKFFKTTKNYENEGKIYPKGESNNPKIRLTRFIIFLMIIIKFVKNLKWRTPKLRDLSFVNDRQIRLINDISYLHEKNTKNKSKAYFIKNKFLRRKYKELKKKFTQLERFLSKLFYE